MEGQDCDIAILGGGLAGGLIALALNRVRPDLKLALFEQDAHLGGNHVWSFFESDVAASDIWLTEPLIAARWEGYSVHFPAHSRHLSSSYRSITSERLNAVLRDTLPREAIVTGSQVVSARHDRLTLADGTVFTAGGVIDARGPAGLPHMAGGWQKFLGQMLHLETPHGLDAPIVMDARVEQIDGYRFVYCLPFSSDTVFVEDTYYSDSPALDVPALHARISDYAAAQGWKVADIDREETGVLPVIARGDFEAFWRAGAPLARAGARAALVHPLTSYSLPDAVRFAVHIARLPNLSGAALAQASYDRAKAHWRRGRFYRMLTTILFSGAAPHERFRILQRFYQLPEPLIERFYAGRSTAADTARILAGKPPVPLGSALSALAGQGRPLFPLGAPA